MFVRKAKYLDLWKFCKKVQEDNNTLVNDNRRLRSENIALKTKLKIMEKKNGKG